MSDNNFNNKCTICDHRCDAGLLRGQPCGTLDDEDNNMPHKVERYRDEKLSNCTRLIQTSHARHPKSGPRQETNSDRQRYEQNYDKIFRTDKQPVCELCNGKAEPGTCPTCN